MKSVWKFVLAGVLTVGVTGSAQPRAQLVEVYKTPTCGCCGKWVEHLRANGFTVRVTDVESTSTVQTRHRVPPEVRSCHTAIVNGYVVEGHVPAAEVKRLVKERPAILGIAVPGMPLGSPGMEVAGAAPQPYSVMSFDRAGTIDVFATYGR